MARRRTRAHFLWSGCFGRLYEATGDDHYAQEAIVLGDQILASQERELQPWSIPLTGYFYTGPKHENLFHRFHIGQEQEPILALIRLCEAFPDHAKWMKWYSAVMLHSEYYLKAGVRCRRAVWSAACGGVSRERSQTRSRRKKLDAPARR